MGPLTSWSPSCFSYSVSVSYISGQYEQMVRQAVEVMNHLLWDGFDRVQMNGQPLGPSAHTSGHVYERHSIIATRKYEVAQFGQALVHPVYFSLQQLRIGGQQVRCLHVVLARLGGQEGPNGEESVLYLRKCLLRFGSNIPESHQTDNRIQLIDCSICLDAHVMLRHTRTAQQGRGAIVSGAGINLHWASA